MGATTALPSWTEVADAYRSELALLEGPGPYPMLDELLALLGSTRTPPRYGSSSTPTS